MSKVLTIQRSKWRTGGDGVEGKGPTRLLNSLGLMCCLGFDALACGLEADQIIGASEPCEIDQCKAPDAYLISPRFYKNFGCYHETDAITNAIKHNDDPELADDQREALIREDLKALGWDDVVFVD